METFEYFPSLLFFVVEIFYKWWKFYVRAEKSFFLKGPKKDSRQNKFESEYKCFNVSSILHALIKIMLRVGYQFQNLHHAPGNFDNVIKETS